LIITHREALIALADEVYNMQAGVLIATEQQPLKLEPKAA
jgi:ABC-type transport system involved in cytochrome bd biosynthesis fused ATPase/permease subunit